MAEEVVAVEYEYGNGLYQITDTNQIHQRLQKDADFFKEYFKKYSTEFCGVVEEIDDGNAEEIRPKFKWDRGATKFFVEEYFKRRNRFRDPKIKKRNLWSEIFQEMCAAGYEVEDEETLDRKMRNMKKTYKNIKDNKNSTGRGRIQWEYYDEFEEIFSNDRTVNCGPTISSFASGVQAGSSFASEVQAGSSSASEVQAGSSFASEVQAGSSFGSEVQAVSSFSSEVGAPSSLRIDVAASSVPSPDTARVVSPKRRTSLHLMRKKMLLNEEHKKKLMEGIHKTLKESNKLLKERNDLIRQLLNRNMSSSTN